MEEYRKPSWLAQRKQQFKQQKWEKRLRVMSKRYERHVFLLAVGVLLVGVIGVLFLFTSPVASEETLNDEMLATLIAEQKAKQATDVTQDGSGSRTGPPSVLSVTTQPSGAVVLLDQEMLGVTPLKDYVLPGGTYALTVQITGYATVDTLVVLEEGTAAELSVPLRKGAAYASLSDGEAGAERRATVPLLRSSPAPEAPRAARTASDDFEAQLARATAERSGDDASPPKEIRLIADEAIASDETVEATSDEETRPSAPSQTSPSQAEPGPDLAASAPPVEPPAAPTSESATLAARTGTLKVLVKPWGSIYIDGALQQRETDVRYTTSLPPDVYRVTAVHPTLGTSEHTVHVTAGEEASLEVDFNTPARSAEASPVSAAGDSGGIAMPTFENQ